MSEWWTYRLDDFLLFSPRVYWRMFALHNAAFWPLQLVALCAGLVMILLVFMRPKGQGLTAGLIAAASWGMVAWSFMWNRYATINWAAFYLVPAFALQAALLAIAGIRGLGFGRRDLAARSGLLLSFGSILGYPLLPPLFGRPWGSAEIFGLAPDPTAMATLGVLLSARSVLLPLLLPIPALWLLLSGLTLHTMGEAQAWLPIGAVAVSLAALALRLRSAPPV